MRLPLLVTLTIAICYLLFQPRIINYLLPTARTNYLDQLLQQTKSTKHLDPQKYWETREFYYPGVFYVFQDGLSIDNITDFVHQTGINLKLKGDFPILVYKSPKWSSYESLVNTNQLADLVDLPSSTPIYQDSQTIIYQIDNKVLIFFIKPYDELKVTNGFIYTKEAILKDYYYWFGVSVITR
ncbi:hypothetical protein COW38_01900 [Candidatus Collierbacteria bacterium CG17_big_fil_post_rev_8_21_14_2_50_45_7]|uniref:Uncharacterized protein n=2 Tax=Microgenomates group TaxID=1794810 RepID=A0A2M7FPU9_9BACT|nr:MAG: hypothetical protein COS52_02525 [Candidatus Roizmanbacteria bacterium CG03_land_8_20_14_0_80_39_12]PIW07912.1 MAG: hypothetical protein COW38_01900 [Candidatus Collierbacteria bacterium CG17_big_fil_post_rev_8_21_14_2_50_45_7]